MFDIIQGWINEVLEKLIPKPQPPLVPIPIKNNPQPQPPKKKPRAWDHEHADFQAWDAILTELVSQSILRKLIPLDVIALYPEYKDSEENRIEFWCQLISIMARYESNFDPLCYYEESGDLKGVTSRGLLQISIASANSYGANLESENQLHDVRTNIRCGILILERWVARDNVMTGGSIGAWRGGARYWSVLRDTSKSKPKIMAYLREVFVPKEGTSVHNQGTVSREQVADSIVKHMTKNLGQRETNGKNRSPVIDLILKRVSSSLGNPYCAAAAWCAVDDACSELHLKNPVKKTASSQSLYANAPKKYQKQSSGKKGDGFCLQQRNDSSHGHFGILRDNQVNLKTFPTIEANTNGEGSRDGDGWYNKTRSTDGDSSKKFRGFVDFAQWIIDANEGS